MLLGVIATGASQALTVSLAWTCTTSARVLVCISCIHVSDIHVYVATPTLLLLYDAPNRMITNTIH